jgi:hypothetical protein
MLSAMAAACGCGLKPRIMDKPSLKQLDLLSIMLDFLGEAFPQ